MILFLDRLPLWPLDAAMDLSALMAILPIVPTEPGRIRPPATYRPFRWRLDTGCTSMGLIQPPDLREAGLSSSRLPAPSRPLYTASGAVISAARRPLDIWLMSNIAAYRDKPFRIRTDPGIHVGTAVRVAPNHFPIIGMAALRWAGVKVELDFKRASVSVWVPASLGSSLLHRMGHAVGLRRTATVGWANEPPR